MRLGFFTMPLHPVGKEWRLTLAEDRNLANRHPAVTAAEIMDLDRNAIFLESIEHMIALWTHGRMRKRCAARWN